MIDFGDTILHECICGSNVWVLGVTFEDYEISGYFTDMKCAGCNAKAKAPTPLDAPGYY